MSSNTVHIQYVGACYGVKVEVLNPGDVLIWNGGLTSTVISRRKLSAHFWGVTMREHDGSVYERRMKSGRLVAVTGETAKRHGVA
jgi:hypothetical protein